MATRSVLSSHKKGFYYEKSNNKIRACRWITRPVLTACTSTGLNQFPVHTLNAGKVIFSNIKADKQAHGMIVTGNVKRRSQAGKRAPIPGHIHIILKSINGNELETIKARTHRKYGNSKLWHFDGLLKTVPNEGSTIVVKYHGRHPE